jgi:hypothetical protein
MRTAVIILILMTCHQVSFGQGTKGELMVRKKTSGREFRIKTHKKLKVRTLDGETFKGKDYHVENNMIIFHQKDSIEMHEIDYIRARAYGDNKRILGASVLTIIGVSATIGGINVVSLIKYVNSGYGSVNPIPYILPGALITIVGIRSMAPRKFNAKQWVFQ